MSIVELGVSWIFSNRLEKKNNELYLTNLRRSKDVPEATIVTESAEGDVRIHERLHLMLDVKNLDGATIRYS